MHLMQHWWRNRVREKKSATAKQNKKEVGDSARKCFVSPKEPSNLIQCWILFNLHTPLHFARRKTLFASSIHFASWRKKKIEQHERERKFSRKKNKISIWEKAWKTSTRARMAACEQVWEVLQCIIFLPTWKILLHNRCNSDFLMQQYLAQARNWRWKMHLSGAYGRKKAQRRDDYRFFFLFVGKFTSLRGTITAGYSWFCHRCWGFELLRQTLNRYKFIESHGFGRVGKFDLLVTFNAVESQLMSCRLKLLCRIRMTRVENDGKNFLAKNEGSVYSINFIHKSRALLFLVMFRDFSWLFCVTF